MVDEVRLKVLQAELRAVSLNIQSRTNALQEERNSLDRYISQQKESFRETEALLSIREKYRELIEDAIDELTVVDAEYTITPDAPPADAGSV